MSEFVLWGFDASTYVRTIKMLLSCANMDGLTSASSSLPSPSA